MTTMTSNLRKLTLPLLALAVVVSACDDATGVEEHANPEGIAIMHGSEELYSYMLIQGTPLPPLDLSVGTYDVAVVFLDAEGDPLPHEEHAEDEEEELIVTIEDSDVLGWTPEDHGAGDEHEHLEFHGELEAVMEGSTSMTLCLPHGAHCDFQVTIDVDVAG